MRFMERVNEMKHPLLVLLAIGLIVRLILAPLLTFNIDMGYWTQVIDVFKNGFGLYGTAGYYYTPIWGYYLGFVSGFMQLFGITDYGQFVSELEHLVNSDFCVSTFVTSIQFNFIVKLPLIIVDTVVALLVYRFVNDRTENRNKALLAFALVFFCPLIITESSVHGTFDNLSVMFLILSVIFMTDRKYFIAGVAFGAATLTKFFPIFMIFFLVAYVLRKEGVDKNGVRKVLEAIAGAVVMFVLIYLPNIIKGDFWQSLYFLAYRIGITRETLASISPLMTVAIIAVLVLIIGIIAFVISRYGPRFMEKMNSLDEGKRNKDAAKWIARVMAVVLVLVAIVSIIKTDSLEGGAFKLVLLVCVFSLFLEIYLAFRLLMLKEMNDKNVITLLYLSALAIIYWPCAISYTLIFIPFVCIFIAMVDEKYKKWFIIFAVLATFCEITAYLLSPTSLFVQLGIGIGSLVPLYDFMANPWILGMTGATILTAIFEIPAYITMLYLSFKFYWERKKEGRLWTEN